MRKFFCIIWMMGQVLLAQNSFEKVTIKGWEAHPDYPRLMRSLKTVKDSIRLVQQLKTFQLLQEEKGWAEIRWDSIAIKDQQAQVKGYLGPIYSLEEITFQGIGELYLEKAGLKNFTRKRRPLYWPALETRLDICLQLFQEEGYPFASFLQQDLQYIPHSRDSIGVAVVYQFDTGPFVTMDTIMVKGNIRENPRFIYNLIRLAPQDVYKNQRIRDIPSILNNSIYYQNVGPAKITFTPYKTARLELDLERKKSSKFDLLVGILPAQNEDQTLQWTGSGDILLISPLSLGTVLEFQFDKLVETSQRTYARLQLPYILRTPFRAEASIELNRQLSDFLTVQGNFAGFYSLSPFLNAKFYFRTRNSRLLQDALVDTTGLTAALLDGNRTSVGAGLTYDNVDYNINPSRGWTADLEIGAGQKTINDNRSLPERWYEEAIPTQPIQEVTLDIHGYYQLARRHILHAANRTYWLGARQYFENDQLQVGGSQSIRGFNENEFFTDFYSFFTLEYRFQLEKRSFLYAFADASYLRNQVRGEQLFPWGTGLGMQYGTKTGLLTLTYAVGRAANIPLQPSRGKIHIGFINQF
ncbi:MAG: BamA/TamA family outer membrane protein [Bacteroidota bacterium]